MQKIALAALCRLRHALPMIASLMMYARPELAEAHNHLWTNIRDALIARGVAAPQGLSQNVEEFAVWQDPEMVLAQTCGMPYRTRLHGHVHLVATPDYALADCPAGHYRSAIVVRADDPRCKLSEYVQARLAFNMAHSQSGFAALYTHMRPSGQWFRTRIASGGHLNSARMIAQGSADIAALDAQTWRLIQRYEPWADRLRVLEYTAPTPALPYITGHKFNPDLVFAALSEALSALPPAQANALDLHGLVRIPASDYLAVPNPPDSAST